jgi:hypothetical protein
MVVKRTLKCNNIVTCLSVIIDGVFRLDIGFIDHLQVVAKNNCNTITISTFYKITLFSSPQCLH